MKLFKSNFFNTKYRILKDGFAGYEAQFQKWYFPFWTQCFGSNTSKTLEDAMKVCDFHACRIVQYYTPKKVL